MKRFSRRWPEVKNKTKGSAFLLTTRADAVAACLRLPGAYEDYPFDDPNWTAMRHRGNQKIFALVFEREGSYLDQCKSATHVGRFLAKNFFCRGPAYHMNKEHWVSVILDGSMKNEDICRLIEESFALTAPKNRHQKAQRRSPDC